MTRTNLTVLDLRNMQGAGQAVVGLWFKPQTQ